MTARGQNYCRFYM